VEITAVRPAEGNQMISFQDRHVVADRLILPVPEALADILRIHVVRDVAGLGLAADFQCAAKSEALRRAARIRPLPEVPQIAEDESVRGRGSDGAGQARRPYGRLLRPWAQGGRNAKLIVSNCAANIHLAVGETDVLVVAIRQIEMFLLAKVVIDAA